MIIGAYIGIGLWSSIFIWAVWMGWRAKIRLVKRLNARQGTLTLIRDLENRRAGYDSGREHLARRDAGRPGRETDGMATHPGSLARYHAEKGLD